jgi:hypothetical protein
MFGSGKPKILDWSLMKDTLQGIGALRYYAGDSGEGGNQELVYTAIIDLWANKIVSIEPYSWGATPAQWSWQAASVTVTDPDGNANEIQLRKGKGAPRPVARDETGEWDPFGGTANTKGQRRAGRSGGGGGGGGGGNFLNWLFR